MPGSFSLSRIVSVIARAVGPQWDVEALPSSEAAVEGQSGRKIFS